MKKLNEMTIAMACDHSGFGLKHMIRLYLEREGAKVKDFGCNEPDRCDYPDYVHPLADAVSKGEYEYGIIICGNGNGVCMAANRHHGVRAAVCWNERLADSVRWHDDANVLALPAIFITPDTALNIVHTFFSSDFDAAKHTNRVKKIDNE